jgi:hypothetical protein
LTVWGSIVNGFFGGTLETESLFYRLNILLDQSLDFVNVDFLKRFRVADLERSCRAWPSEGTGELKSRESEKKISYLIAEIIKIKKTLIPAKSFPNSL